MVCLLPLLPQEYILDSWKAIIKTAANSDEWAPFRKYFVNYWLNKYPTRTLNCSETHHRTTNLLEGWHRRLNIKIPKKPSLIFFIDKIRKESIHFDYIIKKHIFYSSKPNRKKSVVLFEMAYKNYLGKLSKKAITPLEFIKKMLYISWKYNTQ